MNTTTNLVEDGKMLAGQKTGIRCGLDEAIDDIRQGRTNEYSCSKELFGKLGI